jgi:hypothetical protein
MTDPAAGAIPAAAGSCAALDDRALLSALQAGEEWAFEAMVRMFGGRLLAVARHRAQRRGCA